MLHTNSIHSILRKIGHVIHIVVHQFVCKTSAKKNPKTVKLVLVQIDLVHLKIQIVLDQFELKLIQICYIQIRYIQFHVKLDT